MNECFFIPNLIRTFVTESIQNTIIMKYDPKYDQIVAQGLVTLAKLNYIGRGGELPQGSEDFSKLWTDNTYTEK